MAQPPSTAPAKLPTNPLNPAAIPPQMPPGMPPMPMPPPGMPGAPPMPFPMPGMPGMPFPIYPGMKPLKGKGPQPLDKWVNVPPNNTVYVNNLNEKTSRDEIVNGLREVFGQFGKVLDVTCYTKIKRCKGQAWVVMEKTESATKAIIELQNFFFFNKPMRVSYSKNVSDATLKRDGKPLPQRARPPKKKKQKKKPMVEETPKKKKKKKKSKDKKKTDEDEEMKEMDNTHNTNSHSHNHNRDNRHDKNGKSHKGSTRTTRKMAPPNKMLFLQNLPKDATK
eukprot:CAMPEP_0201566442 /NCGR_PEP_ID=MMETSP0190_2-20130828/6200_1 /ASSEMBLY_ACC=CAM_ASM_000263 /TAXON_ID=37353 /ORGANISM="Rosalina sp." /LENGTH=278 /DNA_ID=CAMNT_0047985143 /DNA_START=17 /DNA_END=850 /DNA_ORIENTATION=-